MRQTEEIILSDDPLLRIQAEISEVEKREIELRNEHRDLALKTAENTPPVSPTNSDKTNEDQQSDDSGFVVSPSVAKKFESKNNFKKNKVVTPAAQPVTTLHKPMVLTRAMSTPQLFQVSPLKKFNMNPSQKGIMQRFIASRGKIVQQNQTNHFQSNLIMSPIELNSKHTPMMISHVPARPTFVTMQSAPASIERDEKGRPIRKGFVPIEEKIQCELRDLKCRETELKLKRRQILRESKTNLLDYDESYESNDDELNNLDNEVDEIDYPPMFGKLRAAKSIDALNNSSSISSRDTPSPLFERINNRYNHQPVPQPRKPTNALKPAVSLAQLCDLDPKEAPSSHKLIERWEKLIEQKQLKDKQAIIH